MPTHLRAASEAGGDERRRWLEALPAHVDDVAGQWGLEVGDAFEPGGSCSWVAPATDADGRDLVLKVAWRHTESLHEAEGLAALGRGAAAEVHAFEHLGPEDDTTVMLLERCRPGTVLRHQPEAEQHEVLIDLLRQVWAVALPVDHPFRPLSVMADDWAARSEVRHAAHPGHLDAGVVRDGLALFRELARPAAGDVLLFTDLHAGNVLASERRPWLLIDPKPYVGDAHYDVLQHLLNCSASLRADPIGLVTTVASHAGLDPDRLRQWLFARCVQEAFADVPAWPDLEPLLLVLGRR